MNKVADRNVVFDEQGHKLVLGTNDHLATGGEGVVYARGERVFKVYLDAAKAVRARIADKVAVLRTLRHPGVASPVGVLRNSAGAFVGIELARQAGEPVCKLFTNTGRDAHLFGNEQTAQLAQNMREVVDFAHSHQALLVDANELNWLAQGVRAVAIDTDSWALPGFPATAIMASIRDPRLQAGPHGALPFDQGSDWFAWAVVTFQLWTGIHPYKGTHPDFARGAMTERMAAGVSVFNRDVRLPAAARPLSDIPDALRHWYQDVFDRGQRGAPPGRWGFTKGAVFSAGPSIQPSSAHLQATALLRLGSQIVHAVNGFVVARQGPGLLLYDAVQRRHVTWATDKLLRGLLNGSAAVLRFNDVPVFVHCNGAYLELTTETAAPGNALPSRAPRLWQHGQRLFSLVEGVSNGLVELRVAGTGERAVLGVDKQWPVNVLASQFFRGCFFQDCLGTPFIGVLEGQGLLQLRAQNLRGFQVLDGLALDRHNVWLMGLRKSDGQTVRMRLSAVGDEFAVVEQDVVSHAQLDGAVLASGVGVVRLGRDLRVSRGLQSKQLDDCGLSPKAAIFACEHRLAAFEADQVSLLSMAGDSHR